MCKNKRNISFYKQFPVFFDVINQQKLLSVILVNGRLGFYTNGFFCLFAPSFHLIMHRKRNFYSYRKLISLIFWVLLPVVLLADPTPPPPDIDPTPTPPPPPGLHIDDYVWALIFIGVVYVAYLHFINKLSKS